MLFRPLCAPLTSLHLWKILLGAFVALSFQPAVRAAEFAQQAKRPNLLFILADDLGYGDLGCYGQSQIRTPCIDQLAWEGTRFTQFYAGSTVCAPSRCVLMTGLHTGHCCIRGNARVSLRTEDFTVTELLKQAGYTTALIGKWGLGQENSEGVPTRQGFDEFFGYLDQRHAHNYFPTFLWRGETRVSLKNVVPGDGEFGAGVAAEKLEYSPDLMIREALSFIDRNHDRPFFLYFAATLPHANNEAGKKGMEIPDYGAYRDKEWPEPQKGLAAMISRLDTDVGRIMDALKKHHLDQNTLVLFSSDNGPHREGGNDPDFFKSNGLLRGIKRDLYEGGIRVPFIVRWPGQVPAGRVSEQVGSFADFLPTVAEIVSSKPPTGLDGRSILAAILGKETRAERDDPLYWEFYERVSAQAVRLGNWKGIVRPLGGEQLELYDLTSDVGETKNVAAEHPDVVKTLLKTIRASHTPSPLWKVRR